MWFFFACSSIFSEAKEDSQEIDETNPFEFCALEGLLLALTSRLEKTYNDLEVEILDWTAKLTTLWYQSVLEGFRTKNSDLNQMLSRIKHTKTVLDVNDLPTSQDAATIYEKHDADGGRFFGNLCGYWFVLAWSSGFAGL